MQRIYIDMDGVLCDFKAAYLESKAAHPEIEFPQSVVGIFKSLTPIPGAINAVNELRTKAEVYILSAPSTRNPHSYSEKRIWVEEHFDYPFTKNLILCCHKHLLRGDFLIDDFGTGKGQDRFEGELIHFGSDRFPDWPAVTAYLRNKISP